MKNIFRFQKRRQDAFSPKGFYIGSSYVGFLPDGSKLLFPTEEEYIEYVEELNDNVA